MTARKRRFFANPLPGFFWALLVLCIAGAVAAIIYAFNPAVAGYLVAGTASDTTYRFEQMSLARPSFNLQVSMGRIVPVVSGHDIRGVYIFGIGSYQFAPPLASARIMKSDIGLDTIEDTFNAIYIPIGYQELQDLLYKSGALPCDDLNAVARAERLLEGDRDHVAASLPFSQARLLDYSDEIAFFVLIHGDRLGTVTYSEGRNLTMRFLTIGGTHISLPNPAGTDARMLAPLPENLLPITLSLFAANMMLLFALTYILTLDLQQASDNPLLSRRWPFLGFSIVLVFIEVSYGLISERLGLGPPEQNAMYFLLALLIFFCLFRFQLPLTVVGITRVHIGRGLLLAVLLGAIAPIATTLSVPHGLAVDLEQFTGELAHTFLVIGLLQSLYIHGCLQNSFASVLGGFGGLIMAAIVSAITANLPLLMAWSPSMGLLPLQPALIHPVATMFTGYLFLRTQNLAAASVLRTLLVIIPRIFLF